MQDKKLTDEQAKRRASLDKAKAETAQAFELLSDAKKIFSIDGTKEAQADVDKAGAALAKKKEVELQARIKLAQSGDYLPKENERHLYHAKLDKPFFDSRTGKQLSNPYVQIFGVPDWNQFEVHGPSQGFTYEILWNPIEFES